MFAMKSQVIFVLILFLSLAGGCPTDFVALDGGCYRLVQRELGWDSAQAYCSQSTGAHLAIITSQEEQTAIEGYFTSLDLRANVWIGMDELYGDYTYWWTDGKLVEDYYTNFYSSASGRDHAYLAYEFPYNWQWLYHNSYETKYALCEISI